MTVGHKIEQPLEASFKVGFASAQRLQGFAPVGDGFIGVVEPSRKKSPQAVGLEKPSLDCVENRFIQFRHRNAVALACRSASTGPV
ncbi:hypothetical protein WJT74_07845 [Sphingomicrobium sp. XHP0239]